MEDHSSALPRQAARAEPSDRAGERGAAAGGEKDQRRELSGLEAPGVWVASPGQVANRGQMWSEFPLLSPTAVSVLDDRGTIHWH